MTKELFMKQLENKLHGIPTDDVKGQLDIMKNC